MRAGLDDQAELLQQKLAKALSGVALLSCPPPHQQNTEYSFTCPMQGGRGNTNSQRWGFETVGSTGKTGSNIVLEPVCFKNG